MTNGRWYKLGQSVESRGCTCVFLYLYVYFQVQMSNGRWYKLGQPVESGGCTCVFLYLYVYLQVLSNGRWYKLGQPVESGGWCRSSRSGDLAVWEIQMCLTDNLHNISLVTSSLLGTRMMIM